MRAAIVPGCPDLLARLDLLVDTGDALLVLDFKTSRCRWNPVRLADAAPQLHLYADLARPLAEGKPLRLTPLSYRVVPTCFSHTYFPYFLLHSFTLHLQLHLPDRPAESTDRFDSVARLNEAGRWLAGPALWP
jgi:hypothetical protein